MPSLLFFLSFTSFSQNLSDDLLLYYPMNNNATDAGEYDFNGILIRAIDAIDRFGNILSKIFRNDYILQNL